ncbi:outer membrane beta-barrel protein [Flavivirga jejuensis]|uniref:Outer membrane beta-barrel protein n=1 Tax=Flavivirga jejuensis TaxID=870487 RepID=A0ABT8WP93_9FLAO|nr:outer membrane beta-barrel protein [Flavivirga jejuensis]MDO5974799.1 outer membrane beta-barrel protein [Flavivirga jejuensis]
MKKLFTLSMLFMATVLFAQEEEVTEKKLNISGSVDAYYKTNLTSTDVGSQNTGTSFANETGFALGMANVIASYEGEKTGAVADLAFGPRGLEAVGGDDAIFVNQLYAYWNVSESTTLTLGRFNTYLGYEVISPTGNFNYSTSFMFSYGPFSHVGLKADFALSDDFSLMLAVMNVTDENFNGTSGGSVPGAYSIGTQLGYKGQFLNFYYDNDAKLGFEIDYTGGFDVSDEFYLGINAAYQKNDDLDTGFYGVALYPQYSFSDAFALGLRGEYFAENGDYGVIGLGVTDADGDASVFATTLTGSYTIENLVIKPELRLDSGSEDGAFFDNDSEATKSLAAFTLAAIYSF